MKKAGYLVQTVAAIGFAFQAHASDITIDSIPYAEAIANSLVNDCPKTAEEAKDTNKIRACLKTTVSAAYDNAARLSTYIKDNVTTEKPFASGMAQGDLLAYCELPVKKLIKKDFPSLQAYSEQILGAAKECILSKRRAQEAVGIIFNPTADNTVANHINCMRGRECVSAVNSNNPIFIP